MNLDLTKMQHKLWKEQMSQMYDTQPEFKTDVEQLIELFKNFDKQGFNEQEIRGIMDKKRESQARDQRRQALVRMFNKNRSLASALQQKSVLDNEDSLICMFQELAREHERKEKAKSQMLQYS